MLHLQSAQMLKTLEKSLTRNLPESLKEMTDDLDHYTNTYQIFSKDPKSCEEFLGKSDVINWKQHLQIQSTQSSLDEVIQSLAAAKLVKVKKTQCILYSRPKTVKKLMPSLLDTQNLRPEPGTPPVPNQEMFKLSSLDVTHAALVDKLWHFGGNERSRRFIERCVRTFPSSCLLGPEGTPVSWALMDYTGEMRMGGTLPEYQGQGLVSYVLYTQAQTLEKLGFPVYSHTDKTNKAMQKISHNLHHVTMPNDWNQWSCVPL
ncbi:PREDICTED: glycine N-phenylacetyltransferase-like isoform X2 [Chinchilla lanigera]|uniref:glycine N-phenylacetyltransferase-like isoform X2 n=1 Tax=Chinchilla lanigera TaxID=34839 RepID=UPI00038EB0A9|nr:PREDICTED: glycine N-phenylacetyltransferase-like isoform X2 [Chinchilla lanigera]